MVLVVSQYLISRGRWCGLRVCVDACDACPKMCPVFCGLLFA